MEINNRDDLKEYFRANKRPTEAQFGDLIDSIALKSEIPQVETKPYKVFSALLRIEDESWEVGNPSYVLKYGILEDTIGDINVYLSRHYELVIADQSGEGKLNFERRFITIGALRDDFNFDAVIETADNSNDFLKLNCRIKSDGISLPEIDVPLFYNLPIEIRVYDEVIELPFPDGPIGPGVPINPQNPNVKS